MIPEGSYLATAKSASFGVASTGNEQIAIDFEIADTGERIAYVGTFTAKSMEYTVEHLRALGWEGDDLSEIPDLVARGLPPVEIVIRHDTYEGKTTAKVRFINRPGASRFAFKSKLEGADLKRFAASMKGQLGGVATKRKTDVPF